VQKNKVFIFISVLHLGETGSLTKLNLSKGMNFTLQCEVYGNRDQATTKDGQQCFNTCYPKKRIHAVAKPRRTPPPSFG
jgi:hypothetical protein